MCSGTIEVREAAGEEEIEAVRELWREYWTSLGFDGEFQNFGVEVRGLPGEYTAPRGVLLIGTLDWAPAGTIALRPLNGYACEVKRLYVRPACRGVGLARMLLERVLRKAREFGYREAYCDTMPYMAEALRLYAWAGFETVQPYSADATPGAVYLRLELV